MMPCADSTDGYARRVLRCIFEAAVRSADPAEAVRQHLPAPPRGRCVVVGAGKAAAVMAAALDQAWADVPLSGVVVTRYGHAVPAGRVTVLEAAHPVPDENSVHAAERILAAVQGLQPDDLVVALISGGGSSLLALPGPGMTLADKQAVNRALLASGATIREMNVLRRQLSGIKGGRLAQAALPARLCTLIVSDVPGDDPAAVASGPTVADPASREEARAIVERYRMRLPAAAQAILASPMPVVAPHPAHTLSIIATPMTALQAAARHASTLGVAPLILGDALQGEAAQMGTVLAGIGRSVACHGLPLAAPAVLLAGGEATVTMAGAGSGRGGRNQESLLAMAVALEGQPNLWALAADSDGIDGSGDAAGAIIAPDTLIRARALGLDARASLAAHDSYHFFSALGDLLVTGPTGTNVNDIRLMLVTG
ncbi:MAG: glycerate kinase [Lautropia sp.]|nr:glycerate kinase [Lautropia sp.]